MIFTDARGDLHSLSDIPFKPSQILISKNRKGTLRGLHKSPYAKYIYCIEGEILDFFVHPDQGETEVTLRAGESVLVPAGAPHGFYACEDSTIIYLLDGEYDPVTDTVVYWKTPEYIFSRLSAIGPRIISDKDMNANYAEKYDVLMLGATGYLGGYAEAELKKAGMSVLAVHTRLNDATAIAEHIKKSQCRYVVCAAGISGRPTIDWCEDNEFETWETNYADMLNLMRICKKFDVHLTIFGSGLVYTGIGMGSYTENDEPDFTEKVYTRYRIQLEQATKLFPNVLYLRIIFPVTLDGHAKCFLSKLKTRAMNVHDISVPLTVVPSLFPQIPLMLHNGLVGVYNFVNDGVAALTWLLDQSGTRWALAENATTKRGNFALDVTKLKQTGILVQRVEEAVADYI